MTEVVIGLIILVLVVMKRKQILSLLNKPTPKINTKDFVIETLTQLNYSPEIDKENGYIEFMYKDKPFIIAAEEEDDIIRIVLIPRFNIHTFKDIQNYHIMIHELERIHPIKVLPYKFINGKYVDIAICADILFIKEIPNIDLFLHKNLDYIIKIKDEIYTLLQHEYVYSIQEDKDRVRIKGFQKYNN